MIEIVNSMGEWIAYVNSTEFASAKSLQALLGYLRGKVPELAAAAQQESDNDIDTFSFD